MNQPGVHTSVQVLGQRGGAETAQHTSVQLAPGHLTFGRISVSFLISMHFVCQQTLALPLYPEVPMFVS